MNTSALEVIVRLSDKLTCCMLPIHQSVGNSPGFSSHILSSFYWEYVLYAMCLYSLFIFLFSSARCIWAHHSDLCLDWCFFSLPAHWNSEQVHGQKLRHSVRFIHQMRTWVTCKSTCLPGVIASQKDTAFLFLVLFLFFFLDRFGSSFRNGWVLSPKVQDLKSLFKVTAHVFLELNHRLKWEKSKGCVWFTALVPQYMGCTLHLVTSTWISVVHSSNLNVLPQQPLPISSIWDVRFNHILHLLNFHCMRFNCSGGCWIQALSYFYLWVTQSQVYTNTAMFMYSYACTYTVYIYYAIVT